MAIRPKPETLDLDPSTPADQLAMRCSQLFYDTDQMLQILFTDLSNASSSGSSSLPDPVTVAHGGTGVTGLTAHGVLVGEGGSPVVATAAGATHTVLHGQGGSADPSFSAVVEADLSLSNITTADVTTSQHGFTPKAPNDTSKFLRGDATWAAPPSGEVNRVPQPFAGRKAAWIQHVIGTNSVHGATLNSANITSTTADFTDATYFDLTSATSGTTAFVAFNNLFCYSDHLPTFRARVFTGPDITAQRLFGGFTDGTSFSNADTQSAACVAFRYSTVVPDGGWVGIAYDGTTQSVTSTITTISANTVYILEILVTTTSSATFNIYSNTNGTLLGTQTLSTHLPTGISGTKQLRPSVLMVPTASATKHLYCAWFYAETAG